jgi:hypothetical protein
MPGFLYYFPDKNLVSQKELPALGFGYLGEASAFSSTGVQRGPGGGSGCICSLDNVPGDKCHVDLPNQTWRKFGSHWVGFWRDQQPTPEELARQEMISGHPVRLADGDRWIAPVARSLRIRESGDELSLAWARELPQRLDLAEDGKTWVNSGILPRYQPLWDIAEKWAEVRWGGGGRDSDLAGQAAVDAAVLCLQTNYRIGRAEVALLGCLTDELVNRILDLLIDEPVAVEFIKKKAASQLLKDAESVGQNSGDGPAGSTPNTPQP